MAAYIAAPPRGRPLAKPARRYSREACELVARFVARPGHPAHESLPRLIAAVFAPQ